MSTEIKIGRAHKSARIPAESDGVSMDHALLTIDDCGNWVLEDTGSLNGTFIEEPDGSLIPISRMRISPSTKIVLGSKKVNGFSFIAGSLTGDDGRPIFNGNPDTPLWKELRTKLHRQQDEERALRRKTKICELLRTTSAGIALLLTWGVGLWKYRDDVQAQLNITRLGMTIIPIAVGISIWALLLKRDDIAAKRRSILVCPRCGRPISEHAVEYGLCPFCKSHS